MWMPFSTPMSERSKRTDLDAEMAFGEGNHQKISASLVQVFRPKMPQIAQKWQNATQVETWP